MKDVSKLNVSMEKLFTDDKKIRDGVRALDLLFNKNREVIMSEAAGIMDDRRKKILMILKKMFSGYQVEHDGLINVLMDVTARQDTILRLSKKMKIAGGTV